MSSWVNCGAGSEDLWRRDFRHKMNDEFVFAFTQGFYFSRNPSVCAIPIIEEWVELQARKVLRDYLLICRHTQQPSQEHSTFGPDADQEI